ncbi:family 43 glycosylhydrolase [Hymenobacter sp. BT175]|uniref:family 43 glycosylhydrolase n=1 Tax=Hymenobacter translucens TaxID=2886507 RepID=UPI001D0F216C|nr:family 43 glycosylhydrolase [Hymenobacter translucens]MCC2545573.1 family 43 glycosylhydrolase [Hymenobacter translucens]
MSFELATETYMPALAEVGHSADWQQAVHAGPSPATLANYSNLILPGDFPDPTITKIGDTYWASATSAEWGAVFPLLKSTNLTDWELVGHVFPDHLPEWAAGNFWAPEISHENGKTYICYTARRKGGPLCVAVASADDPAGPYTDHGPLIGQRLGSIDGFPVRDEKGKLYMVWKEDGNAKDKPTPIWAQRMNEERTALLGKRVELFRNDVPWEGCLVEGSAIVRHNDYFYMFYAGNGCCGRCCTYATGVARSRTLLGPWEKCDQNPVLKKNTTWKCPGHGTVVVHDDRWFLLHHAYHTDSHEFVGRQGMFSEFTWNAEGWPEFVGGSPQAVPHADVSQLNITDEFEGTHLAPTWQWPIGVRPRAEVGSGALQLSASPTTLGSIVAQRTYVATCKAVATVDTTTLASGTFAGLSAVGDPKNALALLAGDGKLQVWHVKDGVSQLLSESELAPCAALTMRLQAWGGTRFRFTYSIDGTAWVPVQLDSFAVNGTYLPPWDRGVRIGLLAKGPESGSATFRHFSLRNYR